MSGYTLTHRAPFLSAAALTLNRLSQRLKHSSRIATWMDRILGTLFHQPGLRPYLQRSCWSVMHGPLTLLLLTFSFVAQADIYKWTDPSGKVHFGDQKPAHLELAAMELNINTYQSVSYGKTKGRVRSKDGRKVAMYSTDWCGYCKQVRKYYAQQSISFTEYDIEKNSRAMTQYTKLGATGVPVILVGRKHMNGFSIKGFQKIYD